MMSRVIYLMVSFSLTLSDHTILKIVGSASCLWTIAASVTPLG